MHKSGQAMIRLATFALIVGCAVCDTTCSAAEAGALPDTSCVNPVGFGADPSGTRDSTEAIRAAIRSASRVFGSLAPGVVCLPAGRFKTTSTIAITSDDVTIQGAGYFATVLVPAGDYGDVFYVAKAKPAPFLFGANFANLRIYTTANPTHGAGIHFNQANSSTITHVQVDGMFGAYDIESSLHLFFDGANSVGNNSNAGSYGYRFHRFTGKSVNPSENFVENVNVRGLSGQSISYALIINDSDGVQFSNFHFGWSSGAAVLLQPQYSNDVIFGIVFGNGGFDNSRYDVYATDIPGYTGSMRLWSFAGTIFETASVDGFYADTPALSDVIAVGDQFTLCGRHGINIGAGSRFKFAQSIFTANNRSGTGGNHVNLAGTVQDVNVDGASYSTATSKHAVISNIAISDSADWISGQAQSFSGAAGPDIRVESTGKAIKITTLGGASLESSLPPRP
jgi:hypothetical protein